jgi:hypothetical protein
MLFYQVLSSESEPLRADTSFSILKLNEKFRKLLLRPQLILIEW